MLKIKHVPHPCVDSNLTGKSYFFILARRSAVNQEGVAGIEQCGCCVGNPWGAVDKNKEDPERREVDV